MTEAMVSPCPDGLIEVDMRAGRGIRWSDVAADIEAGNPVEPVRAEPLGVTPAGDPVFPAQIAGGRPWMI